MSHSKVYLRLRQKLVRDVKFIHAVTAFGREWKEKKKKVRDFVILINDQCLSLFIFISANFHNVLCFKKALLNWSKLPK